MLLTGLLTVAGAETLFAIFRRRTVEPGWYVPACLFTLLIPATVPLSQAALAIVLGVVTGRLAFGGAGKYLASPALLGVMFLYSSHPEAFSAIRIEPGMQFPVVQDVLNLQQRFKNRLQVIWMPGKGFTIFPKLAGCADEFNEFMSNHTTFVPQNRYRSAI